MEISRIMSISRILVDLCAIRQKKNKKHFCRYCLQRFSSEKVFEEHKKVRLKINGKQSVKLRSGLIKFKNYFKQLAVLFKIYTNFESVLKRINSDDKNNNTSYTKMYQEHIPCSFAYKVARIDDRFSEPVVLYRGKSSVNKFTEAILKENKYCKKMIKKHFNKNLVMSVEDERSFKSSNKCWICNQLFAAGNNKVRDHDHVTGKYEGSAHWNCNINLKLSKKVPVIFHNLKAYDSHLIMQEIGKFDVKIGVTPNGLKAKWRYN